MFEKLSFKVKLIIFIILSLIGIGLIVENRIENLREQKKIDISESQTKIEQVKKDEYTLNAEIKDAEQIKKALDKKCDDAINLFFQGKYNECIKLSEEVIKDDDTNVRAHAIKGIVLCYSGKFESGMLSIDKALQINPDYGYARFNKALAYELFGYYDKSLEWYDKALEVEDFIWSYYGKASIYGRKGDAVNTAKYLKIAIQKHENPEAIKEEAKKEIDFEKVRNTKEFQEIIN